MCPRIRVPGPPCLSHYQKARYLRLTPDRKDQPLEITAVNAELASAQAEMPLQWLALAGRRDAQAGRDTFEYDLDGRFPVQRVDVALPGNHAAEWQLESRDTPDADWRPRAAPWMAFRVDAGGRGSRSAAQARLASCAMVTGACVRTARSAASRCCAWATGPRSWCSSRRARRRARWPQAARAQRAESPLPALVAALRKQRGSDWQPVPAYLGTAQVLAGDAALVPQRDWKSWLLWGVLVLSAVMVVVFAPGLLRHKAVPAQAATPEA